MGFQVQSPCQLRGVRENGSVVFRKKECYRDPAAARQRGGVGNVDEEGVLPGFGFRPMKAEADGAGDAGKPRTMQGRTVIETGSGKPGAIEAPQSAQMRYGPGPRISMQASGKHRNAASTGRTHESARPDAWNWTRENARVAGGVHTRLPWIRTQTHYCTPIRNRYIWRETLPTLDTLQLFPSCTGVERCLRAFVSRIRDGVRGRPPLWPAGDPVAEGAACARPVVSPPVRRPDARGGCPSSVACR